MTRLAIAALLVLLVCCTGAGAVSIRSADGVHFRDAQISEWSAADPPDNSADWNWQPAPLFRLPEASSSLWLQFTVQFDEPGISGLLVSGLFSADVYLDGERLGSKGRPDPSAALEIPGPVEQRFMLPAHLRSVGPHQLRLFVSRHHLSPGSRQSGFDVGFDDDARLANALILYALPPLLMVSALLIVGWYFAVLYGGDRSQPSFGLFGLLCLSMALYAVVESWRGLFGYAYDWHVWRMLAVAFLAGSTCWLQVAFVSYLDASALRRWPLLVYAALVVASLIFIPSVDAAIHLNVALAQVLVLLLIFARIRERRRDYVLLGLAVLGSLIVQLVSPHAFLEQWLFVAFAGILMAMLYVLARRVAVLRQAHEQSLINSERLKGELIKQHIQPHFLMNTLSSLSEWIEEDSETAVHMIEVLGDEFRTLSKMAGQSSVALQEEIALCEAHLQLMSLRKRVAFSLRVQGPVDAVRIPPGVLHTLIENAISHNVFREGRFEFVLDVVEQAHGVELVMRAPIGETRRENQGQGGGLRYIEARLKALFGDRWSIENEQTEQQFITRLRLGHADRSR